MPKVESLLETFRGRVHASVPVSRLNAPELSRIKRYFDGRGVIVVGFDPLSSRCRTDTTLFGTLAFEPLKVRCSPIVLDDLVIDCDGKVLLCCQDFQRREPIGDLAKESVAGVLAGIARHRARRRFASGEHDSFSTCAVCYTDGGCRTVVRQQLAGATTVGPAPGVLPPGPQAVVGSPTGAPPPAGR
jgi:hypothetical protein